MKVGCFLLLLVVIVFIGCDEKDPKTESFLNLSDNELSISASGDVKNVYIQSNINWTVSDTPDWCVITIHNEVEKPMIEIVVSPNTSSSNRNALIEVGDETVKKELSVSQEGEPQLKEIAWHTFPVNTIVSAEYTLGEDQKERIYSIKGTKFFINELMREKIYTGKLINKNANSLAELIDYAEYTYNPVVVTGIGGGEFFFDTFRPSFQSTDNMANKIISSVPKQVNRFYYSNKPIEYNSYRQLNLLGRGNLGINLDEMISGKSYMEKEMVFRHGLIYSYYMELFGIVMDYPEKLIQETISDVELSQNLSYVSNIGYGRTAFLIVETNDDVIGVNKVINKMMKNEKLDEQEVSIAGNLKAYYLHFGNNRKLMVEEGTESSITQFVNGVNNSAILPLTFSPSNYLDHSVSHINLHIVLK